MARRDIKSLTGLRGAAALWVACYHLFVPAALVTGVAGRVLGRGYLAVDLFFVLSGFVLALNYGAWFSGRYRWAAFPAFLWRRWARIFPLYGLLLIGRLIYTLARYGTFNLPRPWIAAPLDHPWVEIPANLLLVQSWGVAASILGPAWSVSTEWGAYWLFPLLCLFVLHSRPVVALSGMALAACCLLIAAATHGDLDCWDGQTPGPLLRCAGGFMIGMALWRLSCWPPARRAAGHPMVGWSCVGLLALCLVAGTPDIFIYPLLPPLVLCLACGTSGPAQALAARGPVWLGEISYALYLLHIFLLHPLDQARSALSLVMPSPAADLTGAGLIILFVLAAAHAAHQWVETPTRAWATAVTLPAWTRGSFLTPPTPNPRNLPPPAHRVFPHTTDTVTLRTAR